MRPANLSMRHDGTWWVALILWLSVTPAIAFDDAAFCRQLSDYAIKANREKTHAPDALTTNGAMLVDCDRKIVEFKKSVALSYSELDATWQARRQREWNSAYCRTAEWAPIFVSGWKVSMTVRTFDGRRVTFFAECE